MKTLAVEILSVKGGDQYTVNGEGAKRHSTAKVKMSDGKQTIVNRDVARGGNIDGSNSYKKNRVSVASLMIGGMSLEDAVFASYANHGWVIVDGKKCPRGRDHAFRLNGDWIETFNVTIGPDDHRYGWRPSARISGKVADMAKHEKAQAKAPRADLGGVHDTQKIELDRNKCLIQHRLNGALKAPKRK